MSAELVPIAAISQILPKIVPRHDQPRLFAVAELIGRAQLSSDAEEKNMEAQGDSLAEAVPAPKVSASPVQKSGMPV